jgi:hypothetical protein
VGIVNSTGNVVLDLAAEILRDPTTIYAAFRQCCERLHSQLDEAMSAEWKVTAYSGCNDRLGILFRAMQLAAEHDDKVRALETVVDPMFRDSFANLLFVELGVMPTDEQLLFVGQGLSGLNRELSRFAESAAMTMALKTKSTTDAPADRRPCVVDQKTVPQLFGLVTTAGSKVERVMDGESLECIITNEDQWTLLTLLLRNNGRLSKDQMKGNLPRREGRNRTVARLREKLNSLRLTVGVVGTDYVLSETPV